MSQFSDEQFEASIEQYYKDTDSFRQLLDNRTEEEMVRDDYVLDQHSRGKRMKVVLTKASKKLRLPELAPDSPHYPNWVRYYENLIRIITGDIRIEAYYKNKMETAEGNEPASEEESTQKK